MFKHIVSDMMNNGGKLSPSNHWNWNLGQNDKQEKHKNKSYTDDLYNAIYCELELMLKPLIGVNGMEPIKEETIGKYEDFLHAIDHLGMLPTNLLAFGQQNDWRETDLGSVMDVNLILGYIGNRPNSRRLRVCEIGGGYGRLAEAMACVLPNSVHYCLMDAVPASMMYAYMYLDRQFPDLRVGSYYLNDAYSEDFDFYIMPVWQEQQLPSSYFDICINIESMQEMDQHHVDHYLCLFDRLSIENALIYLSNARDYVFLGEWHIPKHWETLFLNNTPRSWTANHPTHILRKSEGDFSVQRSMLEGAFDQQIATWGDRQTIQELKLNIVDRDNICFKLQQEIDKLSSANDNRTD